MQIIKADLFTMTCPLAHCISSDFALGAGIAKTFKDIGVKDELFRKYKRKWEKVGYCLPVEVNGRKVYNLVTKERYWHKPTYETLRQALCDMAKICRADGTTEIAMPKIGCGLDRLEWTKVEKLIKDIFGDTNTNITICQL